MSSLLNIGVSGLRAHQEALAVTGQNITNANTPGYSRQRVDIVTQVGSVNSQQFDGAGARSERVIRMADEFAIRQVRTDQALFSQMDAMSEQLRQIESVFFGEIAGIDQAIGEFFDALHVANASPASLPDRQVVLNEANALADRFNSVHARLDQQFATVRSLLEANLERVNELAVGISDLNRRISSIDNEINRGAVNPLLDQRDMLLQEMSQYFSVSVVEDNNGQVNVFIGKGQPVVLGSRASVLDLDEAGQVTLRTDISTQADRVTNALSGGEVGGLIEFRERVLTSVLNQVGALAAAISSTVNEVQAQGVDIDGTFGAPLFTDINDEVFARRRVVADIGNTPGNFVDIQVTIHEPLHMTGSDYSLEFSESEPGAFIVRRTSDNALITQGVLREVDTQSLEFDGITVTLAAGEFYPGDRYLLTPSRNIAQDFSVTLEDPSKLALASPVRLTSVDDNIGDAALDVSGIRDQSHPFFDPAGGLVPPLQIVFTSSSTYDIMDATDPLTLRQLDPPMRGLSYTPGVLNELLPLQGNTAVSALGTALAALPDAGIITTDLDSTGNGYPQGSITLTYTDPEGIGVIDQEVIGYPADSSARQIAEILGAQSGVQARAVTELSLAELTDNGVGAPLEIAINGQVLSGFADLDELASAINANATLGNLGISAKSDGTRLNLTALHGHDVTVHVAGDANEGITVINPQGDQLRLNGVAGAYRAATVGGTLVVEMQQGVTMSADAPGVFTSRPEHRPVDFGFGLVMRGVPAVGDSFSVSFNDDAVSDNRNGLKLAQLASAEHIGEPAVTYNSAYASIVLDIGSRQNEANVQREAARVLLDQSVATRESISGVNLDEEAGNLIRLEQAYNASAQVISVARDVFDVLFDAVR